jgi:hypothetical protein
MDELGYERMAQSFAHTGHFSLFGKQGLAYSPLYPILISPIYRATPSAETAYEWVKALNALLLSLSVFPLYAVARTVLSRRRAVGTAALSLLLPLMFYGDFEMSESLAYPVFLVAVWAALRAIRYPRLANDLLLLGAIVLAVGARLQNVALLPAVLTAVVVIPLARPPDGQSRLRAVRAAFSRHWPLFGICSAFVAFILVKRALNGGALPFAGRYANVGTANARLLDIPELALQHLAELDLALGILPFAGALLATYALVHLGFPRRQLVFGLLAMSVTFWLLLEVAYDAAAFDLPGATGAAAPRIHERYLIYVMPFFLIAFVAALRLARPRVSSRAHLLVAVAAALLPAVIPFSKMISEPVSVDSPGLMIVSMKVNGETRPIAFATTMVVVIGVVLGLAFLYAQLRPRPRVAVVTVAIVLLGLSADVAASHHISGLTREKKYASMRQEPGWVDAAAGGRVVTLIGGRGNQALVLPLTAFQNFSIARVYATCGTSFGPDFDERRLMVGRAGALMDGSAPLRASFVLAPSTLGVRGRVVARRPVTGLELVAPSDGLVRVPRPIRC